MTEGRGKQRAMAVPVWRFPAGPEQQGLGCARHATAPTAPEHQVNQVTPVANQGSQLVHACNGAPTLSPACHKGLAYSSSEKGSPAVGHTAWKRAPPSKAATHGWQQQPFAAHLVAGFAQGVGVEHVKAALVGLEEVEVAQLACGEVR